MLNIVSNEYPLHGAAYSNIGGRPENQDSICVRETSLGLLVVISDGMGGGPGGKTASAIAVDAIVDTVLRYSVGSSREEALKVAIGRANEAVVDKMRKVPQLAGMGATAVVALIDSRSAVVANIGDSRCYRVSKGKRVFCTEDHSLVGELVRRKVLTEEQARTSPQSNVITKALGTTNDHVPDIYEICYCKGDRLVLCTDGVWGSMPNDEFMMRLSVASEVGSLARSLASDIDRIGYGNGGHHDNHTMAIIEMDDDSLKTDSMSKIMKIFMMVLGVLLTISVIFNIVCFIKLQNNDLSVELNKKNRMIEVLEPYRMRYNKLIENNGEELKITVAERDSLADIVIDLRHKVDSLIKQAETGSEPAHQPVEAKQKEEKGQTAKAGGSKTPASVCADNLIMALTKLKNTSGTQMSETVKQKAKYRDEAAKYLRQYIERKGASSVQTDNINRLLSSDIIIKVEKNKDKYVSTQVVVKKIDSAIAAAKSLK